MEKFALIGQKLSHSWSQPIHAQYFRLMGMDASYELLETEPEGLADLVTHLRAQEFRGVNVTIPYKVDMMGLVDAVSPEAEAIGALNTVKFDQTLSGYNTDYFGLEQTLRRFGIDVAGQNVILLGTGGVSRAAAALCRDKGCASLIHVSREKKPGMLTYVEYAGMEKSGVLINCTPVGMYPDTARSPVADVTGFFAVVDLIYNPVKTRLLQLAEQAGAIAVNGLYMLVAQAVCAQAIWNGVQAQQEAVDEIYHYMTNYDGGAGK